MGVFDHLLDVAFEFGLLRFAKGHRLGRNHMHQRSPLNARENRRVELFRQSLIIGQDHPAAWSAQRFMCRRCGHMTMRKRRRIFPRRNQPRKMGHIAQNIGPHFIRDRPDCRKINNARNGRAARDDQLGFMFTGKAADLVIIDQIVLLAHAVLDGFKPFA